MLKRKKTVWKTICLTALLCGGVQAVEFIQTEQYSLPEGDVLPHEVWVSAQSVDIVGTVSNDFFAAAPSMSLAGTFLGDVWGAGDSITANGIFKNDMRLAGRTAQVGGTLYGSLTAGGTTVKIDRTAKLYGDAFCFGDNVIIEGSVDGALRIIAQQVTLGGQMNGDVSITAQEIYVLPGTLLNGDLTYTAPNELVLSPSVLLSGELNRRFNPEPVRHILKPNLTEHFLFALAALVTGLVFIGLFPRYTAGTLYSLRNARGLCSLIGFAALFLIPVLAFVLLFTFIGLPLSILIFCFFAILLYLSKIVVALWIGQLILRKKEFNKRGAGTPLTLGLLILYALTAIVPISFAINILIVLFGLGALLFALFKKPVLIIQTPDATHQINKEV